MRGVRSKRRVRILVDSPDLPKQSGGIEITNLLRSSVTEESITKLPLWALPGDYPSGERRRPI